MACSMSNLSKAQALRTGSTGFKVRVRGPLTQMSDRSGIFRRFRNKVDEESDHTTRRCRWNGSHGARA